MTGPCEPEYRAPALRVSRGTCLVTHLREMDSYPSSRTDNGVIAPMSVPNENLDASSGRIRSTGAFLA